MNAFTGNNPETMSWLQPPMFQQPRIALGAGIGDVDRIAKHSTARHVANVKFQEPFYNTANVQTVAEITKLPEAEL
jgi:hypothetical protein